MEILIVVAINAITSFVKNKIKPKYGATGVHVFVFLLALIFALGQAIIMANPSLKEVGTEASKLLIGSVALYEILWKKFNFADEGLY